jgi:hypothetical protein
MTALRANTGPSSYEHARDFIHGVEGSSPAHAFVIGLRTHPLAHGFFNFWE